MQGIYRVYTGYVSKGAAAPKPPPRQNPFQDEAESVQNEALVASGSLFDPDCALGAARVPRGWRAVPHVGSQMAAKLEPNGVKMAFEISLKLGGDLEMPYSLKKR